MARQSDLPKNVIHFIDHCIDSVEQLSILLLLYSSPSRAWTVEELTVALRSTNSLVAKKLDDFYAQKVLLRCGDRKDLHRFLPGSPDVREAVRELATENQVRPYQVIDVIYSRPKRAIRCFSEAFRIRDAQP